MSKKNEVIVRELKAALEVFGTDDQTKQMLMVFILKTYFSAMWDELSGEVEKEARREAKL